jgi:hypothetical protein
MKATHVSPQPYESPSDTRARANRLARELTERTGVTHAVHQFGSGAFENDVRCIVQPKGES